MSPALESTITAAAPVLTMETPAADSTAAVVPFDASVTAVGLSARIFWLRDGIGAILPFS